MRYKEDWDRAKERLEAWWNGEIIDRAAIQVYAPRKGYIPNEVRVPESLKDQWENTDYIIANARERFASTYYGGEAFPCLYPNLGPDILSACLGCNLKYGVETSWAEHFVKDWNEIGQFTLNNNNLWWKKICTLTEKISEDARGDYFVGLTDLHPGFDALAAVRGPEELCIDLTEIPEILSEHSFEIFEVFKGVYDRLQSIAERNLKGSSTWLNVWHPGRWYPVSCDFICMISPAMFETYVLPELVEETKWLDASLFHLDGPGALKHLDALLEVETLNGIQWVPGAGQPSASHWIPVIKKIQEAGKIVTMYAEPNEIKVLLEQLSPKGLLLTTYCSNEEEAKYLIDLAEKLSFKKTLF